jgi:hypothetical protein
VRDTAALEALGIPTALVLPDALVGTARDALRVMRLADQLVVLNEPLYARTLEQIRASMTRAASRLHAILG